MDFYWDRLDAGPGAVLVAARASGVLAAVWCEAAERGERAELAALAARLPKDARLERDRAGFSAGAKAALAAYLADPGTEWNWPAEAVTGTAFQRAVWAACLRIEKGMTKTYGELARETGGGARATGAALGVNPLCVVWPCHRVVGAGGVLTGYAGGLGWKRWLLQHEGVRLDAEGRRVVAARRDRA